MIDPATGQPIPGGDLGSPVMEPNLDSYSDSAVEASGKQIEMPKGGEI